MTKNRTELLACPGCGFKTIDSDIYGSYDICPICEWEDDTVQLANPCSRGGANRESLCEVQAETLKSLPVSITEHRGFSRDKKWRPLSQEEVTRFQSEQEKQRWTNHGETDPKKAYWESTIEVEPAAGADGVPPAQS